MTTLSGCFPPPATRGAFGFRSSRMKYSSWPISTMFVRSWRCPRCGRKFADGLGRVAASPESRQGGHARIVPAGDVLFLHQFQQPPLAHDGIVQVQPGETRSAAGWRGRPPVRESSRRTRGCSRTRGCRASGSPPPARPTGGWAKIVHGIDGPGVAGVVVGDVGGCGRSPDRASSCSATPCRSWRAGTWVPSGNSPFRMRAKRSRFSSTPRLRYGLSRPGSVTVPRVSRISASLRLQM